MLLAESPEREQRRRELIAQQDSLNQGLHVLDELQNTYQDASIYQHTPAHQHENGFDASGFGPPGATPPVDEMEDIYDNTIPHR
jgi:hypothetical protein